MNTSTYKSNLSIKSWAEDDRPREKFQLKGKASLSDAELIAILLGSGNRNQTAVDLAKDILAQAHNNLHELGKFSLNELMQFKGVGEAKAICIAAALELGRRRNAQSVHERVKITSSKDAFLLVSADLIDKPYEEFYMLLLNRSNKVISKEFISRGGITGTVVDPRLVLQTALQKHATSIILFHNHPSGNLKPSENDIQITKKLKEAANLFDISILDHIIVADSSYYSFAEKGIL
jgi:DNA repair protein RadC